MKRWFFISDFSLNPGEINSIMKKAINFTIKRIVDIGVNDMENVSKNEKDRAGVDQPWFFREILDQMNTNIYVTEPETDKILFMNKKMKTVYGLSHPEGEICWKILQDGMSRRCAFCPLEKLLEKKEEHPRIIWQEENAKMECTFENTDTLVTWTDGSLVHMQQSIDITDKITLNRQATMDELCGVLNRRAGKARLARVIQQIRLSGGQAVVSLIDVNDLKQINDKSGHCAGDQALVYVAQLLKKTSGRDDFVFRLGGDEFIVVFMGRSLKEIEGTLINYHKECYEFTKNAQDMDTITFCYGNYLITPGCRLNENEVIACADKTMYQNKLRYHKDQLAGKEDGTALVGGRRENFSYDSMLLYDALIRSTDDYIYMCDMKTGVFCYSPMLVSALGFPSEVMAEPLPYWKKIVHPDDWERFYQSNMEVGDGKTDYHSVEFRALQVNGEYQWLRCRGYLMRDGCNQPSLFAGIMTKLDKQNKIDSLTSLYTIHEFSRRFEDYIRNYYNETIAMVMLGLDDFRNLNDLYNRDFGNRVLKKCGEVIEEELPDNASLYRLDGDKFGILLEHPKEEMVKELFEKLQKRLSRLSVLGRTTVRLTSSGGCAFYPENANSYLDMVKYCEYALQYSKDHGKGCLTIFHQDILQKKSRSLEILKGLQESIARGFQGFSLLYQPQVDGTTGKITGAEALLRWRNEKLSHVSPVEFIPILEDNRLINEVGKWVLKNAVGTLKDFLRYNKEFTVSINVSYLQLLDTSYMKDVIKIIQENDMNPKNIIIELTESYLVKSTQKLGEIFEELRRWGIRVAMDDFGSGYSSLELLKNAPFDIVKIDRAFMTGILSNPFDVSFIQCIIRLCHDVGIAVCQEGVEYEEEYNLLAAMHPDYIQGYFFGKPQPAEDIIKYYLERT